MRGSPKAHEPLRLLTDMSILWRHREAESSPYAVLVILVRQGHPRYECAMRMAF